ncbi:hypothetical protein D3C76_1277190 [compost metagenome]
MFFAQFIDPGLAENDRDAHADAQAQAQQRQQVDRGKGPLQQADTQSTQAEAQQVDGSSCQVPAAGIDHERREHHPRRRNGRENADLQGAGTCFEQTQ